ncbi:SDR family oxidoreductase [Nocardia sp. NPDC058658]|uniref:SDR family oxidoreductase n=1 Tax=Nocardia sp. NPDC058658 TaxID=3346580 RepID=UPI003664F007
MSNGVSRRRIVVVTGAAGGIGAAIAARFAAEDRVVSLWDLDPAVHEFAAAMNANSAHVDSATRPSGSGTACTAIEFSAMTAAGAGAREDNIPNPAPPLDQATVHGVVVDITDAEAVHAAFDKLTADYGTVDVLVHAAGIMVGGSPLEVTAADWARCLSVNATGTMLVTQRAAADMVAAGRGSIVVVSSNAAATPRVGMAAYGAAKAAAVAFTKSLALQVAPLGVRVNLVSPGSTDTTMLRDMFGGAPLDDAAETALLDGDPAAYRLGIPLRRIAAPADIASAVHFLASDGARHITMHDLRVDGGATLDM